MKLKILLIPGWEKLLSFKIMVCLVRELSAIYWAGGGNPHVLIGLRVHSMRISFILPLLNLLQSTQI